MNSEDYIKAYARYEEALETYFDYKAYLYDARMTDKYIERDERIDFDMEADKLDRKIEKLRPKVEARKKESARKVLDTFDAILDKLKSRYDG